MSLVRDLQVLWEAEGDNGLSVIDVVIQGDFGQLPTIEQVDLWQSDLNLTYDVIYDPDGAFSELWDPDGTVPQTYVLDQEGVVIWRAKRNEIMSTRDEIEAVVQGALTP